ncbi:hypothetical protein LN098_003751 [Acinetobacter baumannii]|uniref:hypothetical protein n=1 Tax=Acinetobacter baumannii TaxID=470 RepID=UPI00259F23DB|nr:hypothetical protein [Acinetobacter baumannii]EKT8959122.1 hypothetical protein [Acinetobacter baumannii]EKT8966770.1 hypothetical protein [Acinetobacter baumannii]EKT8970526.1 hypothetical protein [Acinetobacter baumannii]EKT9000737.1 hypothetical protein [Acinetobacter baumannii]EKT9008167.1 hypothetical protein [Acinetobacter baumannii]
MSTPQYQTMKESEVCNAIGWGLIVLGIISGFIFILVFGRIEVASYYGKETVWSGVMIATGIGIIFNGFLAGYLFQKVASILRYHENK